MNRHKPFLGCIIQNYDKGDRKLAEKFVEIENKDSYGLTWYEHAQPYYGSHRGMRFRIARDPMDDVALAPPDKKVLLSLCKLQC